MTSTLLEEVVLMLALSWAKKAAEKPLLSKRKLEGSEQNCFLRQCAGKRQVHPPPWDMWLLAVDTALGHWAEDRNIMHMCVCDHLLPHNVAFTPPLHWQVCSHSASCTFTISSFIKRFGGGGGGGAGVCLWVTCRNECLLWPSCFQSPNRKQNKSLIDIC